MTKRQSVAVVGGGLSGLTSALILARNGHNVTLIEKSPRLGLTVRGFTREGVYFDTGLHYTGGLSENGIVSRYLRYLGMENLDVVAFNDDGFDEVRFADTGQSVLLPVGYEAMTAGLMEQFPDDREAIRTYMRAARDDFTNSSLLNFFLAMQGGAERPRATMPLTAFLRELTDNEHLCAALCIHTLLYGVSPEEVSFTQHAYVSASYFDSVHNFSGGGHTLVAAMERRLRELGATILCGKAVHRLRCEDGKALTHIELEDGATLRVDAAICTTHPKDLADMGEGIFRPSYVEHLRNLEETVSAYMLFGIADTRPECLCGKNLFLCKTPQLANAFGPKAKPEEGPFYIASSPQPHAPHLSDQKGKAGIVVLAPGSFDSVVEWEHSNRGKRPEAYARHKESVMRRIRESIVSQCPELESVRFVEGATPLTMRDYLHTPNGGLYGAKHTVNQFNPMPMTRVPNIWLAGQSVLAPGLMGAMISAFLACGFLLGHDILHKEAACS